MAVEEIAFCDREEGTAILSPASFRDYDAGSSGGRICLSADLPVITGISWDTYGKQFRQRFRLRLTSQGFNEGVPMSTIEELYLSKNLSDLERFLEENRELIPALLQAPEAIGKVFGKSVILSLELQVDPEEGGQELFIRIRNKFSKGEALKLENQFFREWFLERMPSLNGKLNICQERYV